MVKVASLLVALAKALPAVAQILRTAVEQLDAERERQAAARLASKDKAVDAAIDAK